MSDQPTRKPESSDLIFENLQADLLKALRGAESQSDLSFALGFKFNQVARWERGRVRLKWQDFVRLCEHRKIDLNGIFLGVYSFQPGKLRDSPEFIRQLMGFVVGPYSHREIADKAGVSTAMFERWLYGRAEPTLIDILKLLQATTQQSFFAWLARLVDIQKLPSVAYIGFQSRSEQSVEAAFPFAPAIEAAIRAKEYVDSPHSTAILSQLSGVPESVIDSVLPILVETGNLAVEGGKYVVKREIINIQGLTPKEVCGLARYWNDRALKRFLTVDGLPINKDKLPTAFSVRVAPLSKKSSGMILEALLKCHNEISAIVDGDQGPYEEVRVLITNMFSAKDVPEVQN